MDFNKIDRDSKISYVLTNPINTNTKNNQN